MIDTSHLHDLSRAELVERARGAGVERPERMTRPELRDELIRRAAAPEDQLDARGLFGVARSMLASVVEAGLKLPDAARAIRGDGGLELPAASRTPVATVTLAEIYAAQGHTQRAIDMLVEVLASEPDHEEAARVLAALRGQGAPQRSARSGSAESGPPSAPLRDVAPERSAEVPPPPPEALAGETTEYVPAGFVETTGEEIASAEPPPVAAEQAPSSGWDSSEVATEPGREPAAADSDGAPVAAAESLPEATDAALAALFPEARVAAELVVDQQGDTLGLYWEFPPEALDLRGIDPSEGRLAIQVVEFVPEGLRPRRHDRAVYPEHSFTGATRLSGLSPRAAVRAALGWDSEVGFQPVAVARSLDSLLTPSADAPLAERARAALGRV